MTVSRVVYARVFSPRALSATCTSRTTGLARPHIYLHDLGLGFVQVVEARP